MPLKISIGVSRKIGEPNFGSRGASVNFELEFETGLASKPTQLHNRVARLFHLARASVDREHAASRTTNGYNGNPTSNGQSPPRSATPNQIRAIYAISNRQNLDLPELLRQEFGTDMPEDLSLEQASRTIDRIKAASNGTMPVDS